jgi:hypothetical protein
MRSPAMTSYQAYERKGLPEFDAIKADNRSLNTTEPPSLQLHASQIALHSPFIHR